MTYRKTSWLLAGLATLALGIYTLPARAADSPPATTVPTNTQAGTALTPESLGKMLNDMGYEVKAIGNGYYDVVIKRDGWTVYLRFVLSTDMTKLWITSNLETIPDISKVPAEVLTKLLDATQTYGPSFFYLKKDQKNPALRYLEIGLTMDNRAITPAALRVSIESIFANVKSSISLWQASQWKTTPAVAPTKETDKGDSKVSK